MRLLQGDCLEVLKTIDSNSVDSLITDPPAGISFMGKAWDDNKGGRKQWITWMTEVMKECMRVLKPGAHGLVWAIPRTSHWTATALEDAGFEVRDVVTHIFGSGFPKSMDISKAIDKQAGAEREIVGKASIPGGGLGSRIADSTGSHKYTGNIVSDIGVTSEAKQWQGWGTALKPASEHWILIRKPISAKTVAANVLEHGVGGINIDASRVGFQSEADKASAKPGTTPQTIDGNGETHGHMVRAEFHQNQGRFPANLVLSHTSECGDDCDNSCAVAALDGTNMQRFGDSGGASRFFYCAKASKRDKGADNTHPTVKSSTLMSYLIKLITPPSGTVLDPFMGSGSTGVSALKEGFHFIGIEKEPEYFQIAIRRAW